MKAFQDLPAHSKIWVYQSSRPFSATEIETINHVTALFIRSWQSHGETMDASFRVFYNHFLVIGLDEQSAEASGCGIDKSVHFVKSLEKSLELDFFNRLNICYTDATPTSIYNEKENIAVKQIHFSNVDVAHLTSHSYIFNNLVQTKSELESRWIQPVTESWLAPHLQLSVS